MRLAPALVPLLLASGCKHPDYLDSCQRFVQPPAEPIEISLAPFLQVYRGHVRVRLETRLAAPLPVLAQGPEECPLVREPDLIPDERDLQWPEDPSQAEHPDLPGEHVLQEVVYDELQAGHLYDWTVEYSRDDALHGQVLAPPDDPVPLRVAFAGSTMAPVQGELAGILAAEAPDLLLLGGDLQHFDEPADTWAGLFADLQPVTSRALVHAVPGPDDDEEQDELEVMFDRLFEAQGRANGATRYHAFDLAGVRFLGLDASQRLDQATSPQVKWLEEELIPVRTGALRGAVIWLHASPWTLGEEPPAEGLRPVLEQVLDEVPVLAVLTGGNHGYERFEVDGVPWVVDGGGGAPLGDVDARVAERPAEAEARLAASATHGFTLLEIGEEEVELVRVGLDGAEEDRVAYAWP